MAIRIYISLLLIFFFTSTYAHFDFNTNCKTAYSNIISLKFVAAQGLISEEKRNNPSNHIPTLLDNYVDFLTLFVSENEGQFNILQAFQKNRLSILEKGDKNSPYYLYAQAEINIQWAFVKVKFGNYISAAADINSAYKLLIKNQAIYPNFIPNKKSLGLLHVLIGSIPDQFKWATDVIGLDGNVNQGIQELKTVINLSANNNEYSFIIPECAFLLSFVLMNLESAQEELEQHYRLLNSLDKNNLLLYYSRARIASQLGKNDDVIQLLSNYPSGNDYFPFPYLDYLLGKALLNKLDPTANIHFQNFITYYKGKNYIKAAYQKLAWYYLIVKNDPGLYAKTVAKAINNGYDGIGEDKEALKEAQNKIVPNIVLLKTRLLFDGGYYLRALNTLLDKSNNYFKPPKDELEFYYRMARIYHKMAYLDKAIGLYETTVKLGEQYEYYFASYSAFMLGSIYEEKKDTAKAEYYYKKCASMKNHEYKDTIDAKAKAGLNRLKKG